MTVRGWRELSARMSERKAKPEASFAAAAISGKEAEPWRVGIVGCGLDSKHCHFLDYIDACGVRLFESDPMHVHVREPAVDGREAFRVNRL